jgi:hypothetical protein
MKTKKLPEYKISKQLKRKFNQFLEYHPAKRVNRAIREIWMRFLEQSLPGYPLNMDDMIWDIGSLMELLDEAEDETRDWPEP